jgi:hypothetical protein
MSKRKEGERRNRYRIGERAVKRCGQRLGAVAEVSKKSIAFF